MTLLALLFFHHLADVSLQPSWLIKNKKERLWSIYEHCVIWTGVICLGLWWFEIPASIPEVLFLFGGHFAIDWIRYRKLTSWNWIYLDQALHYLQIILVIWL